MPPREGHRPWLRFRRLPRTNLSEIEAVRLDPIQAAKFLDPLPQILAGVRRGPAHTLLLIEVEDEPAGFIVLHPDTRIGGCWWVGTLAIGRDHQGRGLGRLVLAAILRRLRCVPALRAVRLLVVASNIGARRLYEKAGFRRVGYNPLADEILMEWVPGSHLTADDSVGDGTNAMGCSARARRRKFRLRPRSGRHVARVLGTERGPPAPRTLARLGAVPDAAPNRTIAAAAFLAAAMPLTRRSG